MLLPNDVELRLVFEVSMPLLPVHQCGQAQLFPVMRRLEELVIFHQPESVCGNCAHQSSQVEQCYEYDVTIPPAAQDLG